MKKLFVLFYIFIICVEANAGNENIDMCYTTASAKYNVPEVVLRSIASVESDNNSNAVNITGRSVYAETKEQALQIIQSNRDKSIDIGLMQINKWWFNKYNYPLELGLEACWNIHMGAYILHYEYMRHGRDIWKAIAHYHSPTEQFQNRYMNRVYKEIQRWQNIK
ncbi:lytic transglycosylase domain-containing protein [uncultured Brachyspira sp.]|uniref:lytic transglycosylase domain-containing protein n=1 Tax=uncultured Brachyspira sp. TaxID=221953 RepID=UPI00262C7CE1|nr:lytic transglycosylase domain-containing protein [uncultured Brachyspira sp.]